VDTFSPEKRSEIMRRVRSADTRPEIIVRKMLHRAGFRFRLKNSCLPGKPDIVLPKYRAAIFIHGCFWHRHKGCKEAAMPASNRTYWRAKFERNTKRDLRVQGELQRLGWRVFTVWECQLSPRKTERLRGRITEFLDRMVCHKSSSSRHFRPMTKGSLAVGAKHGSQMHRQGRRP
jgi:DNA mismatch endonuclease, patch repair protein